MTAWRIAPFVSSALRAPPLPHCAKRHTVLSLVRLLECCALGLHCADVKMADLQHLRRSRFFVVGGPR